MTSMRSSDQRQDTNPSCAAPTGFLNLSGRYSASNLPALFHAGATHGFSLQRVPPPRSAEPVSESWPLLSFPSAEGVLARPVASHQLHRPPSSRPSDTPVPKDERAREPRSDAPVPKDQHARAAAATPGVYASGRSVTPCFGFTRGLAVGPLLAIVPSKDCSSELGPLLPGSLLSWA